MPFLVSVVRGASGSELIERLGAIYVALSTTWIERQRVAAEPCESWRELARRVALVDEPLDLSKLGSAPPLNLVDHGRWRSVEVLNCLNHIEVLLGAAELLMSSGWIPLGTAPTQQHLEEVDDPSSSLEQRSRIADMEGLDDAGKPFALEAYGGVNYRNNSKAALDLSTLSSHSSKRLLLAARIKAFPADWSKRGIGDSLEASCARRHGGPYRAKAEIVKRWSDEQYMAMEVTNVTVRR